MLKCSSDNCGKEIPEYGFVVLNEDGDLACSQKCADDCDKQKETFLSETIHDDLKFFAWVLGG